jgi:hypothetical protein
MAVPKQMQETYDKIAPLIIEFCDDKANSEYKEYALKLLEKLCRKRPSPLVSGRANTWACSIMYALGQVNFMFDKSQPVHMKTKELADYFGISASTAANKAADIKKMFNMYHFCNEWTLPSGQEKNPFAWMVSVDGLIVDVRTMPLGIQAAAYEKGLIPYIPALQGAQEE